MKAKTIVLFAVMFLIAEAAWTQSKPKLRGHAFRKEKGRTDNVAQSVIINGLNNNDPATNIFSAPRNLIWNDYADGIDRSGRDFSGRDVTDILQRETVELRADQLVYGSTLLDSLEVHYTYFANGEWRIGQKKRLPYPGELFDAIPLGSGRFMLLLSRRCFNTVYAIAYFKPREDPEYVPPPKPLDTLRHHDGGNYINNSYNTTTNNYYGGSQQEMPIRYAGMPQQQMGIMSGLNMGVAMYGQVRPMMPQPMMPPAYEQPRPMQYTNNYTPRPHPSQNYTGQGPAGIQPRPFVSSGNAGSGPRGIAPRGQR